MPPLQMTQLKQTPVLSYYVLSPSPLLHWVLSLPQGQEGVNLIHSTSGGLGCWSLALVRGAVSLGTRELPLAGIGADLAPL